MATVIPFTQMNRPIRVDTQLGPDVLLLTGFNGTEAVSQPFAFQLDLLSIHPEVDPAALLRKPVLVTIRLDNGQKRHIHGLCSRFAQGHQRDNLTSYRAEIVPWLWFLQLSRESRIYQNLKVDEIIEQVFQRLGYADFDNRLLRSYPQRTYCVQYRETHLDFISRLMEEEGIFYYFEHTEEKHVLLLCDDNSAIEPSPAAETARFTMQDSATDEVIWNLEREHAVHASMVTLSDYDPLQPTLDLERSEGEPEFEEIYDYPGEYAQNADKMDPEDGERLARLLLEAEEAEGQIVRGGGNVRGLVPGYNFTLEEHYRGDLNTKYMVTQVQHLATSGQLRAWEADTPVDYRNTFTCIPHEVPYRPRRRTPRPLIHGSQSALVVGPPGEEIHVDKYGRIKVQFYWDRDGQRNENSSCWVRVATPWGGKGYGSVSIPRIGDEVLVAFEEGDPDRPIIIGSVYNADCMPPFELPGAGIQMGMKSRSSKGGGGMNEITMTDTKGDELINVHAQHDMATVIEHDERHTVVAGTQTVTVKGDTSLTVQAGKRSVDVSGGDYDVQSTDAVKIHGKGAGVQVTGDAAGVSVKGTGGSGVAISGTPNVEIKGAALAATEAPAVTINGKATCAVESPLVTITAKSTGILKSPIVDIGDGVVTIHGSSIVLAGGGGAIEIGAAGVTINGGTINVSGGAVNVMGGMVKIN